MYNFKHKMNWPEYYMAFDEWEQRQIANQEMRRYLLRENYPKLMKVYDNFGVDGVKLYLLGKL